MKGKQSIKDHVLELYNHAMWEDLVVPALDTVFLVGWCALHVLGLSGAPLDKLQARVHTRKGARPSPLGGVWG